MYMGYFIVSMVNTVIRVLLAYGMFLSFSGGHLLLAGICLAFLMKRSWIVYDDRYGKNIYVDIGGKR